MCCMSSCLCLATFCTFRSRFVCLLCVNAELYNQNEQGKCDKTIGERALYKYCYNYCYFYVIYLLNNAKVKEENCPENTFSGERMTEKRGVCQSCVDKKKRCLLLKCEISRSPLCSKLSKNKHSPQFPQSPLATVFPLVCSCSICQRFSPLALESSQKYLCLLLS